MAKCAPFSPIELYSMDDKNPVRKLSQKNSRLSIYSKSNSFFPSRRGMGTVRGNQVASPATR